jgi:hypothetical protein
MWDEFALVGGECDRRHPLCHEAEQARHEMKGVETETDSVTAFAGGDYTTNIGARGRDRRAGVDRLRVGRCAVGPRARRFWAQACGRLETRDGETMRVKLPAGLGCAGLAFDQLDLDRERGSAVARIAH